MNIMKIAKIEFEFEYPDEMTDEEIREMSFYDMSYEINYLKCYNVNIEHRKEFD